jgi:phage shock protein A
MGIIGRISRRLKDGTGRLLNRLEDPEETFEYARQNQRDTLRETEERLEDVRSELAAIAADPAVLSSEAGRSKAGTLAREEGNLVASRQRLQDRIAEFDALAAHMAAAKATEAAEAVRRSAEGFRSD